MENIILQESQKKTSLNSGREFSDSFLANDLFASTYSSLEGLSPALYGS